VGLLPKIRAFVQENLGWEDSRWADEAERYERVRKAAHGVPDGWSGPTKSGR
jgi:hypothetical protein